MSKFLSNVSVPHILGDYYGSITQTIAGLSTVLAKAGYLAIQFKVISKITEILLGYKGPEVSIFIATLVILYAASGGVKAVTFTDVVQFFTFGTLLPILALAVWNRMEAAPLQVATIFNSDPLFNFQEVVQWTPGFRETLVLLCYLMMPDLPPQLFQRMVMARNVKQLRQAFIWATLLCLGVYLCLTWIAILLRAEQPNLERDQIVPYLVRYYVYPGLKGFLGIGVLALAMSTIDSVLNSCAVVIAHDILPNIFAHRKTSIGTARLATLGLGFAALLLSLQVQDLLKTLLLSASFYAPIVVIPVLFTVFGFKTSRRVVLMAMGAGALTVASFLLYFQDANSFFPGMLANLIVMLGAHYGLGEKGGWGHNPLPKTGFIQAEDPFL